MLTFTEFAAKSNGFRPQEDLTFALNTWRIIVLYLLIIKRAPGLPPGGLSQSLSSFICYVNTIPNLRKNKSVQQANYATILKK